MKLKGKLLIIIVVSSLFVIYGGIYLYNYNQPVNEYSAHGRHNGVTSIKDMEDEATLIVMGGKSK